MSQIFIQQRNQSSKKLYLTEQNNIEKYDKQRTLTVY